jgi:hypothetical protein
VYLERTWGKLSFEVQNSFNTKESVSMLTRSKTLIVAAILQTLLGLVDMMGAVRILAGGSEGLPPPPGAPPDMGGPPFWAGVLFLIFAVASLFGAYGLWLNQKWGKIITIITRVVMGLFALGDVLNALSLSYPGVASGFAAYVLVSILVIVLVLRREPKPAMA